MARRGTKQLVVTGVLGFAVLCQGEQARAQKAQGSRASADICALLSEGTVRSFSGVQTGTIRHQQASLPQGQRCRYLDANGELVLDILHFDTPAEAREHIQRYGSITNSDNNTGSPFGTDQVNKADDFRLAAEDGERSRENDVTGFAVRHSSTVVAIGADTVSGLPAHDLAKQMQGTALQLAGAELIPWPTQDVCARVPPAAVASLVTLGPALLLSAKNTSAGGRSECLYRFRALDEPRTGDEVSVSLIAEQYLNLDEETQKLSDRVRPPYHTGSTADLLVPSSGGLDEGVALHGANVGHARALNAENDARQNPNFKAHLQEVALLAAGATVPPSAALPAFPPGRLATSTDKLRWHLTQVGQYLFFFLLIGGLPLWMIVSWWRRRRLLATGMPGTARVVQIADTGTTINNSPVIRMLLEVSAQDGRQFQASVRQRVSRLEAPATWVGRTVDVRIDPKNLKRVAVVPPTSTFVS